MTKQQIIANVEPQSDLVESDDITINTNFNGDTGNVNQYTYAYENNGVNTNTIGNMFGNLIGNVFDFATQGNAFRWSSLSDMFARVLDYNYARGDVLGLDKPVTGVSRSGDKLNLSSADGSTLEVETEDDVDENIAVDLGDGKVTNVKVGESNSANTFTYEAATNTVIGSETQSDTLQVGVEQSTDVVVDFNAQTQNVENFDASESAANVTAIGTNFANNVFSASAGNSKFWGGFGGNDIFVGNSSASSAMEIFFERNSGADTVVNSGANDVVNLLDTTLSEISFAGQTSAGFVLRYANGASLTLDGDGDRTFKLQQEGLVAHYEAASRSFTMTSAG